MMNKDTDGRRQTDRSEFADGLRVEALHPPEIATFLRSIPRRIEPTASRVEANWPNDYRSELVQLSDLLVDQIRVIQTLGYPRTSVDDAEDRTDDEGLVARASAAAIELAAWISGVADSAWQEQSDKLRMLQQAVAEAAHLVRRLEASLGDSEGVHDGQGDGGSSTG